MRLSAARRVHLAGPIAALVGVAALTVTGITTATASTHLSTHPGVTRHIQHIGRLEVVTTVFGFTGHTDIFVVPHDVFALRITAVGAAGQGIAGAPGGVGAFAQSFVHVFPGLALAVRVGGNGAAPAPLAGFNGGGAGAMGAGTGGGASDVQTALHHHLLVLAAGGGGAGNVGSCHGSVGGAGGDAGTNGAVGANCTVLHSGGGGGLAGTATAGGAGGFAGAGVHPGAAGAPGAPRVGGAGKASAAGMPLGDSGGGGGGLFGGGGGGSGGFTSPDTAAGGGGGGGSSFGTTTGLAGGPARVVISYVITKPLTIDSNSPLPTGVVGRFYSTALAASGGHPPYRWSVAFGSLPHGLFLHSDGVISGTPTAVGTASFVAKVTDSHGHVETKPFTLTIVGRPDLAVHLRHLETFRHLRLGTYKITVTNTGSSATAIPTRAALNLPRGLFVNHIHMGSTWLCHAHQHFVFCVRRAPIAAHASTAIFVTVFIKAPAGTVQSTNAAVSPIDATPRDNASTDLALIHRR